MEAEQEAKENQPSDVIPSPSFPDLSITSKGNQHQRGKHHPVSGDDQGWRITELDKDGGGGDRQNPNRKDDIKTNHLDQLISIQSPLQVILFEMKVPGSKIKVKRLVSLSGYVVSFG